MPVETIYIFGPGAESIVSQYGVAVGPQFKLVPFDVVPPTIPAELPAAVMLTQSDIASDPLVRRIASMEPVAKRPGLFVYDEVNHTNPDSLALAIEKSWISHSLAQFDELGGAEFATEMIELFKTQSEQFINELDAALQKGDATTARRIVHTLKSTLASYGGRRLRETAQMLENEAANGNLANVQQHVSDFSAGVRKFRELLLATAVSS